MVVILDADKYMAIQGYYKNLFYYFNQVQHINAILGHNNQVISQ